MRWGSGARAFIRGFGEGIALPLVEILFSFLVVILTALQQVATLPGTGEIPVFSVPLLLLIFGVINIVQSLLLGMKRMTYAIGYCVGAVAGMAIFFGFFAPHLAGIFPQIIPRASASATGIVAIVVVGIIVKFAVVSRGAGPRFRL